MKLIWRCYRISSFLNQTFQQCSICWTIFLISGLVAEPPSPQWTLNGHCHIRVPWVTNLQHENYWHEGQLRTRIRDMYHAIPPYMVTCFELDTKHTGHTSLLNFPWWKTFRSDIFCLPVLNLLIKTWLVFGWGGQKQQQQNGEQAQDYC